MVVKDGFMNQAKREFKQSESLSKDNLSKERVWAKREFKQRELSYLNNITQTIKVILLLLE